MKIFFLLKTLFILINFNNFLFAGAPPLNKDPLPTAPYSFIKTKHIIIGVEWEKSSLEKIIPNKLSSTSTVTGGINIFNSKKKQSFSPLSGSYGWVNLPGKNKKEKLVIFSIYGPNKKINKIMQSVYSLKSEIGSNKVTLINNKAIATSSINKKNVLILSAVNMEDCKKASGKDFLITNFSKKNKIYQSISWTANNQCNLTPEKIELKESLEKFKIKKLLWAKTQENSEVIVSEPINEIK